MSITLVLIIWIKIFEFAPHCRISTRNNFSKLKNPFCKTNMGQKTISYIISFIWNSLPDSTKKANSLKTFKHIVKKHYLTWIINDVYMCMCICIYISCVPVAVYISTFGYRLLWSPFDLSILMFFPRLPISFIFFLT